MHTNILSLKLKETTLEI